jgi:hypothetical protein
MFARRAMPICSRKNVRTPLLAGVSVDCCSREIRSGTQARSQAKAPSFDAKKYFDRVNVDVDGFDCSVAKQREFLRDVLARCRNRLHAALRAVWRGEKFMPPHVSPAAPWTR